MYAVKANKVYKINEDEKQKYIDQGYKIAELKGNELVFEEVKVDENKELEKLREENRKLKAELEKLNKQIQKGEGK